MRRNSRFGTTMTTLRLLCTAIHANETLKREIAERTKNLPPATTILDIDAVRDFELYFDPMQAPCEKKIAEVADQSFTETIQIPCFSLTSMIWSHWIPPSKWMRSSDRRLPKIGK
ncbi:hypothetical protein BVY04_02950 [bacterium M21]|nr:hypothetical protein BVY04_02950 [bacterium M21]